MNINDWENIRIPRPWETAETHQRAVDEMMRVRHLQNKKLYAEQQKVIDAYFERSVRAQREQAKKIDELNVANVDLSK